MKIFSQPEAYISDFERHMKEISRGAAVTEITDGVLHDRLKALASRVGVEAPALVHIKSELPNAMVANGGGRNILMVTDGLLKHLGETSQETEAVLAHELGHIKSGLKKDVFLYRFLPITLMPLAFVWARHHYMKKDENLQDAPYSDHPLIRPHRSMLSEAVKDMAASTLGLIAGAELARFSSIRTEYFCDRFAAEHLSPDTMIGALEKIYQKMNGEFLKTVNRNDPLVQASEMESRDWFSKYLSNAMMAHPTLAQRVERLEEMKATAKQATHVGGEAQSSGAGDWLGDLFPGTRVSNRHHGDTVHQERGMGMGHGHGDGGGGDGGGGD